MESRRLVLITLAVPLLAVSVFFGLRLCYDPNVYSGAFALERFPLEFRGADGAAFQAEILATTQPPLLDTPASAPPMLVFQPDRGLDADWNSPNFSTQSGERLARLLGKRFGFASLRFPPRGAPGSRALAGTENDFPLLAEDLAIAVREARAFQANRAPDAAPATPSIFLLGHGEGCAVALAAVLEQNIQPKGLILLNCGGAGSLLDLWAARLMYNMQKSGVSPELQAQARAEWERVRAGKAIPADQREGPVQERTPPDIIAFRSALRHMQSPELAPRREALASRNFFRMIESVALERGVPVLHLTAEYSEELPPQAIEESRQFAESFRAALERNPAVAQPGQRYRFAVVPKADHFLRRTEARPSGFAIVVQRLSPFRELSDFAVEAIAEFVAGDAETSGEE